MSTSSDCICPFSLPLSADEKRHFVHGIRRALEKAEVSPFPRFVVEMTEEDGEVFTGGVRSEKASGQ